MRNMSFALTKPQIRDRSKRVTRRHGWRFLKPGDEIQAVERAQGLRKGQKVKPIAKLRVVDVRQEPLRRMLDEPAYGAAECVQEGFPDMTPAQFVDMFCRTHNGVTPETAVTRIEFTYTEHHS